MICASSRSAIGSPAPTAASFSRTQVPTLGEADGESLWQPRESAANPTSTELPLSGVRIVDLTAFWAGPSATHSLGAFGADVIKIESIQRPDGIRYSGGMRTDVDDWWEYGWVFHAVNANKRSVTLDLESQDGIRLFKQLVSQADAVIENFSPRVMDQFGLGADALLDLKPDLVVVRMAAFGLTGQWRDRVGFAATMEQIAGLAWVTGMPDGAPVPPRGACDPLAGAHAAFALLAALEFADRTGRGQVVEVPMIETVLNVTATQTIEFEVFDEILARRGNRGHPTATQDLYRCAGDDTWIALCARTDAQRKALSELTSGTELAEWLAAQDVGAVVDVLTGAGVPAAVVVSPTLVTDNPQLRHRGFFERLDHPRTGEGWYPTPPFALLDGAERWLHRTPPTLGQHNSEVLTELCRLTAADLDRLAAESVIGTRPKGLRLPRPQRDGHLVIDRHVVGQVREGDLGRAQRDVVGAAEQIIGKTVLPQRRI
jgi:crotonobetainyl-CoA:carnitine CoA-transferase CaiB-like acyl-CoA transferase